MNNNELCVDVWWYSITISALGTEAETARLMEYEVKLAYSYGLETNLEYIGLKTRL